jgi:Fibronectin type III domain
MSGDAVSLNPGGLGRRLSLGLSASAVLLVLLFPAPAAASATAGGRQPVGVQPSVVVNPRTSGALPLPIARYVAPARVGRAVQPRMGVALPRSNHRAAAAAAQPNPMLYQGGAVLHSVKIYVDFWGTEWQATNQAPVMGFITGFFTHLGGSPWAGTMGQYCSGIPTNSSSCPPGANMIHNPADQLQGQYIDTRPVPATPTVSDVQTEAANAAANFGYPSGALFMVYTPSGKSESGFGNQFCAYHSFFSAAGQLIPYGYMPYQPDANGSCGDGLAGFSIVGGHEYAEAVTDPITTPSPGYGGWIDPIAGWQGEIGDKCAWNLNVVRMNGQGWWMQSLFSNQMLAQPASACVFGAPDAPIGVTALAGNAEAAVSWTAPTSNGGSAVSGYRVTPYIALVAQAPTSTALITAVNVTGLANGTAYTFTVAALSMEGPSAESNQSNSVTPATVPGPPTGVTAIGGPGQGQATVAWIAPIDNGGSAILSYMVSCWPICTPVLVGGSTLVAVVTGLPGETVLTFTVTASNSSGAGLPSSASNPIKFRSSVTQSTPVTPSPREPVNQSSPPSNPAPRA